MLVALLRRPPAKKVVMGSVSKGNGIPHSRTAACSGHATHAISQPTGQRNGDGRSSSWLLLRLGLGSGLWKQQSGPGMVEAHVHRLLATEWCKALFSLKKFAKSTLQHFRLYVTKIVQSWTNQAQKICLVNFDQTVQLVFIFIHI